MASHYNIKQATKQPSLSSGIFPDTSKFTSVVADVVQLTGPNINLANRPHCSLCVCFSLPNCCRLLCYSHLCGSVHTGPACCGLTHHIIILPVSLLAFTALLSINCKVMYQNTANDNLGCRRMCQPYLWPLSEMTGCPHVYVCAHRQTESPRRYKQTTWDGY